uniref:Carboxypeptidase n=1 Tax=Globisporangium ultimum (strain ATCC 200006 / CBS 805.95 / DAOM BR144) TaxID=431595 RepID=K3WZY3_GLOUD
MKGFTRAVAALSVALALVSSVSASHRHDKSKELRNAHQIIDLPGLKAKAIEFDQFAGHLELETKEKLFYWYTESQTDPASDPIVLWLNGGPGCSSINGFFTENGPFVVQPDLSLKVNPYGWNRKANIVWVDSPAGVGFSTPLQNAEYYNDDVVADRLHQFVGTFFQKYPELQRRDFYITGESYGGMYIPYLVDRIVNAPIANVTLKGFAIGNPLTDNTIDGNAYLDYYLSHALISRSNYAKAQQDCEHNVAQCMFTPVNCTEKCQTAVDEAFAASDKKEFNHYYIYGDACLLKNSQAAALHYRDDRKPAVVTHRGVIGPCASSYTDSYLNQPDVQLALHVEGSPVQWVDCQPFISKYFTKSLSSLPKYRNILGKGLKALIYSGDADSVVNFIGTERWITQDGLNLTEVGPWRSWLGPDKQIAGYVQDFDGLTFKTIKGAGHMVPAVRPLHGLNLFECYVYGADTCATFKYPSDPYETEAGDFDSEDDNDDDDANKVEDVHDVVQLKKIAAASTTLTSASSASSSGLAYVGGGAVLLVCGFFVYTGRRRHRTARYSSGEERIPFASTV